MKLLVSIGRPLSVLALTVGVASAMTGCKFLKKDEAPDAATAVVEAVDAGAAPEEVAAAEGEDAGATPTTTARVAANPDQIPTPIDDEKMVAQVTKATYKAELDRVEKDVDGEK